MISTLTKNDDCELVDSFSAKMVARRYHADYNVDVSAVLGDLDLIKLYRCNQTGYEFFVPPTIAGTSNFYTQLERHPWYYQRWKWEHEVATSYLNAETRFLEVGAGTGDFLVGANFKTGSQGVGLELNESAIQHAKNKGATIVLQDVISHAENYSGTYDMVCMFQVLEHIADVSGTLAACLTCLKPNGLFIVSVPNNRSFIRKDRWNVLNLPPHHMGRWDEDSLRMAAKIFNLKVENVHLEPLQEIHTDWFLYCQVLGISKSRTVQRSLELLSRVLSLNRLVRYFRYHITGHTIMMVFRK